MALGPWASGYTKTYQRYLRPVFCHQANTALTMTTGRVYLIPVEVERKMTIDCICVPLSGTVAGNMRVGVYADNAETPAGGALLVESASVAKAGTYRRQEVAIADLLIEAGLYWLAVQSDEATTILLAEHNAFAIGGTLEGKQYDRGGGYGAFTNPCPAVVAASNATVILSARIKSLARP